MTLSALARDNAGNCFRVDSAPGAAVISGSVGLGGANRPDDVRTVQQLLNDVDPSDGGPATLLNVDGLVGPLTLKAISHFQSTNLGFSDSRVDPHGPTIHALNAEEAAGTAPVAASSTGGVTAAGRRRRRARLLPNPKVVALVDTLLPEIRSTIRAAAFRLDVVQPFVTTRKQTLPQGPFLSDVRFSLLLLDAIFSFFKFSNPQSVHRKLRTVYFNMEVALNRAFELPPLIATRVIVPNTLAFMEKTAGAYTTPNGAFAPKRLRNNLGQPAGLIFICNNILTDVHNQQINTVIHELAHFVGFGPAGGIIDDVVNGRFENKSTLLNSLTPAQKIRNAEHYAAFSLFAKLNGLPG